MALMQVIIMVRPAEPSRDGIHLPPDVTHAVECRICGWPRLTVVYLGGLADAKAAAYEHYGSMVHAMSEQALLRVRRMRVYNCAPTTTPRRMEVWCPVCLSAVHHADDLVYAIALAHIHATAEHDGEG